MYEYDPAKDNYKITIRYKESDLEYTLRKYHSDQQATFWHFFSRSRLLDFRFDRHKMTLSEELIEGQPPVPEDFLRLIEIEIKNISGN